MFFIFKCAHLNKSKATPSGGVGKNLLFSKSIVSYDVNALFAIDRKFVSIRFHPRRTIVDCKLRQTENNGFRKGR